MVARRVLSRDNRRTDDLDHPLTPGRLLRRAPLAVWLLVALHGLMLLCWSVLTPQFHAPDEPNHAEAVMRLETGQGWGRIGHTFLGVRGHRRHQTESVWDPGATVQPRRATHPSGGCRPPWVAARLGGRR